MKKTILVMDGDKKLLNALSARLKHAGAAVSSRPDGIQGVRTALDEKPNLIAADVFTAIRNQASEAAASEELYAFDRLRRAIIDYLLNGDPPAVPRGTPARPQSANSISAILILEGVPRIGLPRRRVKDSVRIGSIPNNHQALRGGGIRNRRAACEKARRHPFGETKPAWMRCGACRLHKLQVATTSRRPASANL